MRTVLLKRAYREQDDDAVAVERFKLSEGKFFETIDASSPGFVLPAADGWSNLRHFRRTLMHRIGERPPAMAATGADRSSSRSIPASRCSRLRTRPADRNGRRARRTNARPRCRACHRYRQRYAPERGSVRV